MRYSEHLTDDIDGCGSIYPADDSPITPLASLWDWLVVRVIGCDVEVPLETPLQQLMFEDIQVVGAVIRPADCPSTVPPVACCPAPVTCP